MASKTAPRVTAAMCAFGRNVAEPRLSPDGSRLSFVAASLGRAQLIVTRVDGGPAGAPELAVTSQPAPRSIPAYGGGVFDWTPDGSRLVFAAVDGGLWVVPAEGGPARSVVEASSLGPAAAPRVSPDSTRVAYVVDARHVAVAPLDPAAGWPVKVSTTADFCFDPVWSPDSESLAWHEWDVPAMPWDSSRIVLRRSDGTGALTLVAGGPGVSVGQPRFSPDGAHLAFLCDQTGWLNVWLARGDGADARVLFDESFEHGDATWGQGQRSFTWSPDGGTIAFTRNDRGFGVLLLGDVATGDHGQIGRAVHGGLSWVGDRLAGVRSGARTPTQIVVYDLDPVQRDHLADPDTASRLRPRTLARGPVGGFEAADLPEPQVVTWPAGDGFTIAGRLYRPAGAEGPQPTIVWIHGGPTGQWPVMFNARIAYFVDRGWTVLVPDHRGSTGHGRAFAQALAGRWGEADTDDVAEGIRALVQQDIASASRVVVMGGSAGGFTVLNLLAHHGDLCAAGVDLYGVSDLFDLNETTHRFEKHYLQSLVGPLPDVADRFHDRSPVNVVDRITAPLLILQGTDDKVVPPAQSQAIADRLTALGRPVELHLYEGEGHGWQKPETVLDELERIDSFLRRHVLERKP